MARRIDPKNYLSDLIASLAGETGLGPPDPDDIEVRHQQTAWWRGENSAGEPVTLRASCRRRLKNGIRSESSGIGIGRLVGGTEVKLAVLREDLFYPGGCSSLLHLTHGLPFDTHQGVLCCRAAYPADSVAGPEDWFQKFTAQWNAVRRGRKKPSGFQFSLEHVPRMRGLAPTPRTMLFVPADRANSLEFLLREKRFLKIVGREGMIFSLPRGSRLPWQAAQGLLAGLQMALQIGVRLTQSTGAPTIKTLREFVEIAMLVA